MAQPADLADHPPESEAFRLGRAVWLMSTLVKHIEDGRAEVPRNIEDSLRSFVTKEDLR